MLHIDGASMPETANPSSGSISTTQAADDVLIDASGRIGIGLLNPAAKVDISTSAITPGALRIKDGTEGTGKYLFSDNDGTGSWDSPAIERNWYAALYDGPMLGSSGTDLAVRDFTSYIYRYAYLFHERGRKPERRGRHDYHPRRRQVPDKRQYLLGDNPHGTFQSRRRPAPQQGRERKRSLDFLFLGRSVQRRERPAHVYHDPESECRRYPLPGHGRKSIE